MTSAANHVSACRFPFLFGSHILMSSASAFSCCRKVQSIFSSCTLACVPLCCTSCQEGKHLHFHPGKAGRMVLSSMLFLGLLKRLPSASTLTASMHNTHILALELVVTAFLRRHQWTRILMSTAETKCPQYSSAPGALTSTSSVSKTSVELGGIFPHKKKKRHQKNKQYNKLTKQIFPQ